MCVNLVQIVVNLARSSAAVVQLWDKGEGETRFSYASTSGFNAWEVCHPSRRQVEAASESHCIHAIVTRKCTERDAMQHDPPRDVKQQRAVRENSRARGEKDGREGEE